VETELDSGERADPSWSDARTCLDQRDQRPRSLVECRREPHAPGGHDSRSEPTGARQPHSTSTDTNALTRTAVYGTVRTVVWEDGGSNPASYPIIASSSNHLRRSRKSQSLTLCPPRATRCPPWRPVLGQNSRLSLRRAPFRLTAVGSAHTAHNPLGLLSDGSSHVKQVAEVITVLHLVVRRGLWRHVGSLFFIV